MNIKNNNLIESLASYAHNTWSGWMKYLFNQSAENPDGSVTIPKWAVDRWRRQMATDYHLLPENEKDSDRVEAKKIMELL